ncbi:hypothetical protein [Halobaculum halobium]|uniref:Uncharacterized protein n=1 Tax=Halobaculum halobium TaxID=3032281 RepID=A0ABD5TBN9_9EURY|nr:hypothetical protein [Halobaculum sp. SYNS20]
MSAIPPLPDATRLVDRSPPSLVGFGSQFGLLPTLDFGRASAWVNVVLLATLVAG